MTFRPKKYYCTICNKGFRRNKQHYNHVMNAHKKRGMNKKQIVTAIDLELMNMATNKYFGRPYQGNNIPTGNRHYRCGLPVPRFNIGMRTAI